MGSSPHIAHHSHHASLQTDSSLICDSRPTQSHHNLELTFRELSVYSAPLPASRTILTRVVQRWQWRALP